MPGPEGICAPDQAPHSPRLGGRSDAVYRLGAVGQDCRLGLWDIAVPGDDYLAGLPPLRHAHKHFSWLPLPGCGTPLCQATTFLMGSNLLAGMPPANTASVWVFCRNARPRC